MMPSHEITRYNYYTKHVSQNKMIQNIFLCSEQITTSEAAVCSLVLKTKQKNYQVELFHKFLVKKGKRIKEQETFIDIE